MNTNTLLQSANTRAGFAIGIVRNNGHFQVVRMDASSRFVTISVHTTEAAARVAANREWSADMGVAA